MKPISAFRLGVKIYVSILIASAIGIMVNFLFFGAFRQTGTATLLQTLDFLLLLSFAYSAAWREGYSEMNRVKVGVIAYDKWKGFKAGLFSIIPGAAATILTVLFKLFSVDLIWLYRVLNMHAIGYLNFFMNQELTFAELSPWNVLLSGTFLLMIPPVTCGAFILGYRRFSFTEKLYFKNTKKTKLNQKK